MNGKNPKLLGKERTTADQREQMWLLLSDENAHANRKEDELTVEELPAFNLAMLQGHAPEAI